MFQTRPLDGSAAPSSYCDLRPRTPVLHCSISVDVDGAEQMAKDKWLFLGLVWQDFPVLVVQAADWDFDYEIPFAEVCAAMAMRAGPLPPARSSALAKASGLRSLRDYWFGVCVWVCGGGYMLRHSILWFRNFHLHSVLFPVEMRPPEVVPDRPTFGHVPLQTLHQGPSF